MPAFNNYQPTYTGFQPNTVWSPTPIPNVYQPQTSTVQQQPTTNLMTIFVNTEDEVKNYPVAAGLTVLLLSFNQKKFWLKSTDTNGVPQPLRTFPFTEEAPVSNYAANNQNDLVTRTEFKELNDKLNKLLQDLGGVK